MKEFIEKLISKLEEYKYSHLIEHDSKECLYCQEHEYDWCDGRNCLVCAFEKSEKIVNELAEEYKKKKLSRMATTDYIVDKEYCWQKCSAIEMCNECARLKNGTVDYFENYDSLVDEYNNGWIPCSERLPSVGVTVLCYWKKYDRYDNTTSYYYSLMHRNENCQWLSDLGMCNGEVIAWQPLPQPYKEDFSEVFDNLENHDKEVRNKALEEFEPITGYYYKGQQLYVRKGAKDGEINKEE